MSTELPRGSTVWVGLDPFGNEIVARLRRWLGGNDHSMELAAANRLLNDLRLPDLGEDIVIGNGILPRPAASVVAPDDPAGDRIQGALGELLAERQSRAALLWADRELLVPHVWIVADLLSPEIAALPRWLAHLHQRFDLLQVEVRVYLLLRHLSWGRSELEQVEAERRLEALVPLVVPQVAADASPDARPSDTSHATGQIAIVFIVTDRDGIGGRYEAAETAALVQRFTDLLLLGDVAHNHVPGTDRAFVAPLGAGPGGWETVPIFGSVAGEALLWDGPAQFRENAERRRLRLFAALSEPTAPSFDPDYPRLQPVTLGSRGPWPSLDLPRWSPRFWQPAREEFVRATERLDAWLSQAATWRHDMLVIHEDRGTYAQYQSEHFLANYVAELDDHVRAMLDDDTVPGFFAPLRRLFERAMADLRVRQADLRRTHPAGAGQRAAVETVRPPREALARAEDPLVDKLEHKINPLLLTQVAVVTFALALIWTVTILSNLPQTLLGRLLRSLGTATTLLPPDLRERLLSLLDWQPASNQQLWFWSALVLGLPIATMAVFTALRQRVVLERAWKKVYDRARQWRDTATTMLQTSLASTEFDLAARNLAGAEADITHRMDRLRDLRALGGQPIPPEEEPDLAITRTISALRPVAPPLTELQVAQVVSGFRRACRADPGLHAEPDELARTLYQAAARLAGDSEPDLRVELPAIQRELDSALPRDGAVRVQMLDSTVPAEFTRPPLARFLAAPRRIAPHLRTLDGVATVPIPSRDRFYTLVVQSGMSARRILSLPAAELTVDGVDSVVAGPMPRGDAPAPPDPDSVPELPEPPPLAPDPNGVYDELGEDQVVDRAEEPPAAPAAD